MEGTQQPSRPAEAEVQERTSAGQVSARGWKAFMLTGRAETAERVATANEAAMVKNFIVDMTLVGEERRGRRGEARVVWEGDGD
jgi:hypothetical protein